LPADITISDISLKTRFYAYISAVESIGVSSFFNHFYVIRPKATEFGEISLR